MKADIFTKLALTVIAVNLTIMTVKDLSFVPTVEATGPNSVSGLAPNGQYGLVPLNEDGTITVKLKPNDEIDVNIVGVETSDELDVNIDGINTNDELDVNIDEVGGSYVSSGTIKVKMD